MASQRLSGVIFESDTSAAGTRCTGSSLTSFTYVDCLWFTASVGVAIRREALNWQWRNLDRRASAPHRRTYQKHSGCWLLARGRRFGVIASPWKWIHRLTANSVAAAAQSAALPRRPSIDSSSARCPDQLGCLTVVAHLGRSAPTVIGFLVKVAFAFAICRRSNRRSCPCSRYVIRSSCAKSFGPQSVLCGARRLLGAALPGV